MIQDKKIADFLNANLEERRGLTPLQEAVRKAFFFKIIGQENTRNYFNEGNFLLEKIDGVSQLDDGSYKEEPHDQTSLFTKSDALEKLTDVKEFSISDLIKIFPEVVNQKYVWTQTSGRWPRESFFISSPLELAVFFGTFQEVLTLVENGAEVNPKLEHRETSPLAWAKEHKKDDIAKYLELRSAKSVEAELGAFEETAIQLADVSLDAKDDSYNPHEKASPSDIVPSAPLESIAIPSAPPSNIHTNSKSSSSENIDEPLEELPGKISADDVEKTGVSSKNNTENPITAKKGFGKNFVSYDVKINGSLDSLDEEQKEEVYSRLLLRACKSERQVAILQVDTPEGGVKNWSYPIPHLLSLGANSNYIDPKSRSASTPLINLAGNSRSSVENIMSLVEAGADVNYINKDGLSPLNAVAYRQQENNTIEIYLLSAGANPNHRSSKTRPTPLYDELATVKEWGETSGDRWEKKHGSGGAAEFRAEVKRKAFSYAVALIESGANINEKFHYANAYAGWKVSTLGQLNGMIPEEAAILVRAAIRNGQEIDPNSKELNKKVGKIVAHETAEYEKIKLAIPTWPQPVMREPLTTGLAHIEPRKEASAPPAIPAIEEKRNLFASAPQKLSSEEEALNSKLPSSEVPTKKLPAQSRQVAPNRKSTLEKVDDAPIIFPTTPSHKVNAAENPDMIPSAPPISDMPNVPTHRVQNPEGSKATTNSKTPIAR